RDPDRRLRLAERVGVAADRAGGAEQVRGDLVDAAHGVAVLLEQREGTDRMLARARTVGRKPWDLRLWGRERALPATVLVKCAKDDQDLRIDLPAIGPRTVRNASAAGCVGLAVEAGRTLLIDRAETIAEADRLGLFLIGIGVGA
ncbi:UDP-2,3-diacylglucosamine diphosphatase LpxI, partial [Methylobacterium sp. WL116]|uniref:UDP-2,3-diacylglucosamine diphosphatase LpxI domain-containing protein n=1 Tax=Methylobacterium sp. WL116 TaxID=2603889 RepID=UPI0011CC30D2